MDLFNASKQWAERPADERFWTVSEAKQACEAYMQTAREVPVYYRDLRTEAVDGEVRIVGRQDVPANLTHWAFGQLASRAGAPPAYLRTLPATLAAQNINHGLKAHAADDQAKMLVHANGSYLCRAFTSENYRRIWNGQIFGLLELLAEDGWRTPPARPAVKDPRARPATEADLLSRSSTGGGLSVKLGDMIAPAGIYASDRDMFAFLVNEGRMVKAGNGRELATGFFVWNSEVGDKSFGVMRFLYSHICGNHICWDVSDVTEIRLVHVGEAPQRAHRTLKYELRKYADESTYALEGKILEARTLELGTTKEQVLETLLGMVTKKKIDLKAKQLDAAYDIAERHADWYGSPRTLWGAVNGLTELSQQAAYAEDRVRMDKATGRLLDAAF